MSIIRNAKAQINSFNDDVDVVNTKHLQWKESYDALQEEIRSRRELEQEAKDINQIMNELLMAVMPRPEICIQQYVRRAEICIQQYVRRDEKSKKGFNCPFANIKTIIK